MSRKKLLIATAILLLTACTATVFAKMKSISMTSAKNISSDFELIVRNFNRVNPVKTADLSAAATILADQNPDGSFKNINYSDPTMGMWDGTKHWQNLHILVSAWHATHEKKYLSAIIAGLDYWNSAMPVSFNWWWQFVGAPHNAIKVLNNMHGKIPPETIEKMRGIFDRSGIISVRNISPDHQTIYDPSIRQNRVSLTEIKKYSLKKFAKLKKEKFTGQNLVWTAEVMMWNGLYFNDEQLIRGGIKEILGEVITAERGMEGLQVDNSYHQHGAILQFGNYGTSFFTDMACFLSIFEGTKFTPPEEKIKLLWQYFNRGLRWTLYKKQMDILSCGRQIIKNYPGEKYQHIAKFVDLTGKESDKQDLLEAESSLSGSRYFYCSDYLIHRRKDFYFSFKMCSSRVLCSETVNQENLQGNYLGSGVMQYKIAGDEYNEMIALWDYRRLPGLTAVYDNDSLICRRKLNTSPIVGGVCDDENSGTMMLFATEKLEYCKSVATFDKKIVFTLSDVINKTAFPVNSTVDSKRYTVPVEVTSRNGTKYYTDGVHNLSGVKKIVCGETAYTFPQPAELTIAIEEKTVPWKNITIWADGSCSGKTVTIYFSGEKPVSYIVSPAKDAVDSLDSSIIPGVGHAVWDKERKIAYLFFFAPGKANIPGIGRVSCNDKAAIMLTADKVFLSEAEQKGSEIRFSLDDKVYNFNVSGGKYAGKSVSLPR